MWLYAVLSLLPPSMETPALLIGPVIVLAGLLLLPFVFGEGEKSWRRRPIAVLSILLIAVTLGELTHLGTFTPWSPVMDAWSSDSIPPKFLHNRSPSNVRARSFFKRSSAATAMHWIILADSAAPL